MSGFSLSGTQLRDRQREAVGESELHRKVAAGVDKFATRKANVLSQIGLSEHHGDDVDGDANDLRAAARAMRARTISRLPQILERFADQAMAQGVHVHWAGDAAEANAAIVAIAKRVGAKRVVKGKSMATEETDLNAALMEAGADVVETDLGEWIVQLAKDVPSHIIAPALHLDRHDIKRIFDAKAGANDISSEPEVLNAFARKELRHRFLSADMGITGCNLAIAETGSILLVENEGNGRMSSTMPRVHVAMMGMERIVETWDDANIVLNLLARSATGQTVTSYTNIVTGPRRVADADGPEEVHVVILDNGRSDLLGTEFEEMLNCIRCGACLNVCPVYRQTGGHAYGWVYSGPMGAVLTPLLAGKGNPEAAEVANASTLCGACMDACPVGIPLQDLLLAARRKRVDGSAGTSEKAAWRAWSTAWSHTRTYEMSLRGVRVSGGVLGDRISMVPGAKAWTAGRTAPTPAEESFRSMWKRGAL
jgi:L-lactate dehydrogenase complex protein LldF